MQLAGGARARDESEMTRVFLIALPTGFTGFGREHGGKCQVMSEENILRYTDLAALIQMAKAHGWPTIRIVRAMSAGLTYADALKLARKAAPLLDISVSEFLRMRRNE